MMTAMNSHPKGGKVNQQVLFRKPHDGWAIYLYEALDFPLQNDYS